jgi:hypothetical protein
MRFGGALAVLLACLALPGCVEPGYLVRAGWSEARLLLRRQPIDGLLAREDLSADLRTRLEMTLAVRAFAASTLGLNVGDSYTTFAEVPDDSTVWVVSGRPRDALELHSWRYPLVGRLPYRGFFDRRAAERVAADLGRDDLDVEVRPALAFSTLGWFADPLLSTAAERPPRRRRRHRPARALARDALPSRPGGVQRVDRDVRRAARCRRVLLQRAGCGRGALRRCPPALERDARPRPRPRTARRAAPRALRRASGSRPGASGRERRSPGPPAARSSAAGWATPAISCRRTTRRYSGSSST